MQDKSHSAASLVCETPHDLTAVSDVLKALVEKWGPAQMHVSVPRNWVDTTTNGYLDKVPVFFITANTVGIHVQIEDQETGVNATIQLKFELN